MAGRLCLNLLMFFLFTAFSGMAIDSSVWCYRGLYHWLFSCISHEHDTLARGGGRPVARIYRSEANQESSSIALPASQ